MEGPVVWQPLLKTSRRTPNGRRVPNVVLFVRCTIPTAEILFDDPCPPRVTLLPFKAKVHRVRTDLTSTVRDVWREDATKRFLTRPAAAETIDSIESIDLGQVLIPLPAGL
jgi:hypothetical protein